MHVRPVRDGDEPWFLKPFFWNQRRKYGKSLDAARLWARSPRLFVGVAALYGQIDRSSSPLPASLRSLLTVRVSQINGCAFCVDLNSEILLRRGVSLEKLMAVRGWRDSDLFDDRERAALDFSEAVTAPGGEISEKCHARLHELFEEIEIVELTALVAFQNMSSKFNAALGVPPQGFCVLPDTITDGGVSGSRYDRQSGKPT